MTNTTCPALFPQSGYTDTSHLSLSRPAHYYPLLNDTYSQPWRQRSIAAQLFTFRKWNFGFRATNLTAYRLYCNDLRRLRSLGGGGIILGEKVREVCTWLKKNYFSQAFNQVWFQDLF